MKDFLMQLINASFQGSVIIVVVFILRLLLKKAPKSAMAFLWLLAIVRLLLPFQLESNLSLQPDIEVITKNQYQQMEIFGQVLDEAEPMVPAETIKVDPSQAVDPLPTPITPPVEEPAFTIDWVGLLPWLWLGVAAGMLGWSLLSYLQLRRKTKNAVILSEGVWLSPDMDTAFVLGFLRPQIILPAKLAENEQQLVIAHERTHIARLDHWYKLLGFVTLCIHWFNPLVWLAYALLCRDMEMACDEQVVKDMDTQQRKAYSAALLGCSASSRSIAAYPVAFAEVSVKERIVSVLNYKKPGFWAILVGIVAIVFVAVCFLTSPVGSEGQPPREVKNLLVTYLDAMKEDMEEAASYHYFSDSSVESAYKESKDYLTDYEILSWEKIRHGIWVAEVNLKCLSYDDWKTYYQFIGKIDGQYRVIYFYDVDETDDFSQGIDLSPYLDLDDNTIICSLEAYSDEELRQHCIALMKLLRKGEYHYLSYTVTESDPDKPDSYIQQIETPDFFFMEESLYEKQSKNPSSQYASIFAQSGKECYERILLNPGDDWVEKANEDMRATMYTPEYLHDDPKAFETYPLEVCRFEAETWCIFDVTNGSNVKKTMEFRFDKNGTLTSIVIQSSSTYGETTRTYKDLWLTEAEIQQLADNLLDEARKHAAYQQQSDEPELALEETAIRAAITQHFAFRKSILLDGVTEIPQMNSHLLRDELKHRKVLDDGPLKWTGSDYLITEFTLNEKGYSEALVTETVYYEIKDETLEDNTVDEVIVHIIQLSCTDGVYRVEEDAYRENVTDFDSCTFSASKLEQTQKRIVREAIDEYFSEFQAQIFYYDVTVIPGMHPLRLQDLLKHKQALDDAGIEQISSGWRIQEIKLWDREYADVKLTETVTYKVNGETKEEIIEHNITVIGVQTNATVIDDGYYDPVSGFRSSSYVDPSELP